MPVLKINCPFCQFSKDVELLAIPEKAKRVTCPKCHNTFLFNPHETASGTGPYDPSTGVELLKSRNIILAVCFLLTFASLFAGRIYFSKKAIESPVPNFITISERGIATQWMDQIMITDHSGKLLDQIELPEDIIPTQVIWVDDDLWVADYQSGNILIVNTHMQNWLHLKGGRIKGHFKVVPDLDNDRVFVSAGHSIQVFDRSGGFQYAFGKEGRKPGELKFPNQFLMDVDGNLIISNTKRPAIDKFTPDGRFLGTLVIPLGNPIYTFPTDVLILPDRIVTLEGDDFLRDSRIALYDQYGNYLGEFDEIEDFVEIGDIAAWEGRVFASDLKKGKVYALDASDLSYIGEYSNDLKQLGEHFQVESFIWSWLSLFCLAALLLLLLPVIFFYVKFRIRAKKVKTMPASNADLMRGVKKDASSHGGPDSVETVNPQKKKHFKAFILSAMFPGLGQFYKRHIVRGALLMVCFTPIALTIAINAEPTYVESIDWGPQSIEHLKRVLAIGLPLYFLGLWDALRN